jgi:hypothetical protein
MVLVLLVRWARGRRTTTMGEETAWIYHAPSPSPSTFTVSAPVPSSSAH